MQAAPRDALSASVSGQADSSNLVAHDFTANLRFADMLGSAPSGYGVRVGDIRYLTAGKAAGCHRFDQYVARSIDG